MRRLAVAIVGIAVALATREARAADERDGWRTEALSLAWSAPPECPSSADVRAATLKLVAGDRRPTRARPLEARGAVSRDASGVFHAELETGTGAEKSKRVVDGESCASVTEAVELMLAIAIDPEAAAVPPPPPPPAEPDVPAKPARASAPRTTQVVVAASGLVENGFFGGIAPGVALAGGVATGRLLVEADASWTAVREATLDAKTNEGASAWVASAVARGCFTVLENASIGLAPCAGAGVAWISASGFGSTNESHANAFVPLANAGLRARMPLSDTFAVRIDGDVVAPLQRAEFVIDNAGTVAKSPAISLRGSAGIEARF